MSYSHTVIACNQRTIESEDRQAMHRLRYEVFAKRLGWDVPVAGKMEKDHYDDLPDVSYILAKAPDDRVDGCWRLLPTNGPYMLRDTFPELLHGQPAPVADDCWEISRFAVATSPFSTANGTFGPISKALMVEAARFALAHDINRYVTVTTPIMERMLKSLGLQIHRIGSPIQIGVAKAVACMVEIDNAGLDAIGFQPVYPTQ